MEEGLLPTRGKVITLPFDLPLDGVLEEDRSTVRDVIYVLHSLKMCKSWSALPKNQGYEVMGLIDSNTCSEVDFRDLELFKRVDPLRVNTVSVRMIIGPPATFSVVIFVLRKSEPVVLEDQDVIRIRRKRKFWNLGGT